MKVELVKLVAVFGGIGLCGIFIRFARAEYLLRGLEHPYIYGVFAVGIFCAVLIPIIILKGLDIDYIQLLYRTGRSL